MYSAVANFVTLYSSFFRYVLCFILLGEHEYPCHRLALFVVFVPRVSGMSCFSGECLQKQCMYNVSLTRKNSTHKHIGVK